MAIDVCVGAISGLLLSVIANMVSDDINSFRRKSAVRSIALYIVFAILLVGVFKWLRITGGFQARQTAAGTHQNRHDCNQPPAPNRPQDSITDESGGNTGANSASQVPPDSGTALKPHDTITQPQAAKAPQVFSDLESGLPSQLELNGSSATQPPMNKDP